MIYLVIPIIAALVYLYLKVRKLDKTTPKVQQMPNGSYTLTFNKQDIYNAKPKEK